MKIALSAYDPQWQTQFSHAQERVMRALGPVAVSVHHVGSTSVRGLSAKPVIDMVLMVIDSSDEASYVRLLNEAGFTLHARESEWHEHRLLKLESPAVNLHVFSHHCPEVARMLRFRNLLREDRSAREVYEAKKKELAERDWNRVQDYADAKSEVVERLLGSVQGAQS